MSENKHNSYKTTYTKVTYTTAEKLKKVCKLNSLSETTNF